MRRDVSLNTGISSTKLYACNIFLQLVKNIEKLTSARVLLAELPYVVDACGHTLIGYHVYSCIVRLILVAGFIFYCVR